MNKSTQHKRRIVLAVGGTGGHIFPAQELARKLGACDVLFAGAHLSSNRFFERAEFAYSDIASATPFRGGWAGRLRAPYVALKGLAQSIALLRRVRPALVVGFGSYHSFPVLSAAALLRVPMVLVEADIFPGKVNRLFSRWARCTATLFSAAHAHVRGNARVIHPLTAWAEAGCARSPAEARQQLGLKPDAFTLLVFGGSQGARAINVRIPALLRACTERGMCVQLIHLTGDEEMAISMQEECRSLGIAHWIHARTSRMDLAWQAATLAIARAGAGALAEMIAFGVPAILIPFPAASHGHQEKNARFMAELGGGLWLAEEALTDEALRALFLEAVEKRGHFQQRLRYARESERKEELTRILDEYLQ